MICEKDFNVISVFDVLAKEKNYETVKSTPDEVWLCSLIIKTKWKTISDHLLYK